MRGPADNKPTHDVIARIAQAIWEREGRPNGRDHEHWIEARTLIEEGRAEAEFPEAASAGPSEDVPEAFGGPRGWPDGAKPRKAARASKRIVPTPNTASGDEATPGPRDPAPIPATNIEGYVAIPSETDEAASALRDDPVPPPARAGRKRR